MRALLVGTTGWMVDAFYRRVHLGGALPRTGPLLVVANHVNQLVDVMLALHTIGRPATVLAKAPLFHQPPLSWLIRGIGALPVHRARDGERDEAAKAETKRSLATATDVVGHGGCLLLFPEGVSHDEPGVLKAHSGAARVALAGARIAGGLGLDDLQIVPLGLLYRDKTRLFSEAATLLGPPIPWRDLLQTAAGDGDDNDDDDNRKAVDALTARIEDALRDVTLHLEHWEDLPLLEAATALGGFQQANDDDVQRSLVALGTGIAHMREQAPRALAELRRRVDRRAQRLNRLGARVHEHQERHVVATAVVRHAAACLAAPVLAIAGVITRRPALVATARAAVADAWAFFRLLLRGRVGDRVRAEQQALLRDVDTLLQAARA